VDRSREVVVLSAVRTPIGKYGGSLKDLPPTDLAAGVVRESIQRANMDAKEIGHVVFGNVIHTEAKDIYFSRVAAIRGGIRVEAPALTVNRLCGSGLQAIVSAAQAILLGDAEAAVAGGRRA
jgi:acetyl-CoA C-acetyltransferase